jgi:hypothetical protein
MKRDWSNLVTRVVALYGALLSMHVGEWAPRQWCNYSQDPTVGDGCGVALSS